MPQPPTPPQSPVPPQAVSPTLLLPTARAASARTPAILASRDASRAGGGQAEPDPLLACLQVKETIDLDAATRSDAAATARDSVDGASLLALETAEGETLFIRADRLAEVVADQYPEAIQDGALDFMHLQTVMAGQPSRAGAGQALWRSVTRMVLGSDTLADEARAQSLERVRAWATERGLGITQDEAIALASWVGAQALMQKIESQLADEEGLYHWASGAALSAADRLTANDARLSWGDKEALIFIHGTASSTVGSFSALAENTETWRALKARFGDNLFALEHRTFSRSPIDNALTLAELLPAGAAFSVVTHSRGGLVGDLLCLGSAGVHREDLLKHYKRTRLPGAAEESDATPWAQPMREWYEQEERAKLNRLMDLLDQKNFRIGRYVRVASPAAGTSLASENLDVFLSGLLSLVVKALSWVGGAAVGSVTGGAGGELARRGLDRLLSVNKRIVLEIAQRRFQPHVVPGIEAMLPDAPLGRLLVQAPRRQGIEMAIIAGDLQGGSVWWRIVVAFTDYAFFNNLPNDQVVNTRSMLAGVAAEGAHVRLERASTAHHFSYFRTPSTRSAVLRWLVEQDATRRIQGFTLQEPLATQQARERRRLQGTRAARVKNTRPVLIYLPGIMGSQLEIRRDVAAEKGSGDLVWFDPLSVGGGGIRRIAIDQPHVQTADVIWLAYGRLAGHLEDTHWVERFDYDWRKSLDELAIALEQRIEASLNEHPDQPVRILAHSMGGLVARMLFAKKPQLWERVVARKGGRLLMLGTPNHGSHSMVENLLGRSSTVRTIATLDLTHSMQQILDIVAAYPGALTLLPRPGFEDTGGPANFDYFQHATWPQLAAANKDRWLGGGVAGKPAQALLDATRTAWQALQTAPALPHPERIAYVCGQASATACGLQRESGRLVTLYTPRGDGTVTWASSALAGLGDDRYWMMPADHANLVNTFAHFDAIDELLETGTTGRLARLSQSRAATDKRIFAGGAAPMPGPKTPEAALMTVLGGAFALPDAPETGMTLRVGVTAMDLRYVQAPIMVGHYEADPITYAEALIDEHLVAGGLSARANAGVYAGEIGTHTLVMMPSGSTRTGALRSRGALVVGLGRLGDLTRQRLLETVREGVIHYLFEMNERASPTRGVVAENAGEALPSAEAHADSALPGVELHSLLLGYSSSVRMSVRDSVMITTQAVAEACAAFRRAVPAEKRHIAGVTQLTFIELFRDAATTAAHAVRQLPMQLGTQLGHLGIKLDPAQYLEEKSGARERLSLDAPTDQWPQLQILSADPEPTTPSKGRPAPLPGKLRFIFTGRRARSEEVIEQNQPGLVERLVDQTTGSTRQWSDVSLGRTLFRLLVPVDYMQSAREADNLLLVLDSATANIPWEMLEADDEPLVLQTRIIRSLATTRFRAQVKESRGNNALVIGNPSTAGYRQRFPTVESDDESGSLSNLKSAELEATALADLFEQNGYSVTRRIGREFSALSIMNELFARDYRILAIAAHGVFAAMDPDGYEHTGVVLSDGLFLGATEIGKMQPVPEVVLLNCCHLGRMGATSSASRLAASIARELIEIGVRCVVVSGWEVDDDAAKTFAVTFFDSLLRERQPFGEAIHQARRETRQRHPNLNTFGAYQAYGDPIFQLGRESRRGPTDGKTYASIHELLQALSVLAGEMDAGRHLSLEWVDQRLQVQYARSAPAWRDDPGVLMRVGQLYARCGAEGAAQAVEHFLKAMNTRDPWERVSLHTVESVANLEARYLGGQDHRGIESALARMESLLKLMAPAGRADEEILFADLLPRMGGNEERAGIVGSAFKRMALQHCAAGRPWSEVSIWIKRAADAYAAGLNHGAPQLTPYATLNFVVLQFLVGTQPAKVAAEHAAWAEACREESKRQFSQSGDMWAATVILQGRVAELLCSGQALPDALDIIKHYREATQGVPGLRPKWDSIIDHWRLVADLLQARKQSGDDARASTLREVAAGLSSLQPPPGDGSTGRTADDAGLRVDAETMPIAVPGAVRASAPRRARRRSAGRKPAPAKPATPPKPKPDTSAKTKPKTSAKAKAKAKATTNAKTNAKTQADKVPAKVARAKAASTGRKKRNP